MKKIAFNRPQATHRDPGELMGWRRVAIGSENTIVSIALAVLVLLPLSEIVLRSVFRTGLPGSSTYVQHFTLIISMLGGAIAAREDRLLSISTLTTYLRGKLQTTARIFSNVVAAAICALLCQASMAFILTERAGGKSLDYGIPVWVVLLILPLGFGLIALRLIWHASHSWKGRTLALILTGLIIGVLARAPIDPDRLVVPLLIILLVAILFGAPIFTAISGITLALLWGEGLPLAMIPLKHYSLVTNSILPSIPLFALAGYFLAEGGTSTRLVRVFQALVGQFRGGPAVVTVLVCAFFTSFTGASGVTILALGGLLFPVLIQSQYSERDTLGLLTSSGSLGLLFPPCIPLILYAITASTVVSNLTTGEAEIAQISMEKMFLGGIGPGILLVIMTGWWGVSRGPKDKATLQEFDRIEAWRSIWIAKWELLLPVVALTALFSGLATPVEAAAVTAGYAFVVETFVYRDLNLLKDTTRIMTECSLLVGGVLLILGVAMGLSNYLIFEQIPSRAVEWVTASIDSRWLFLLSLNLSLLLVGCIMDIFSAIVVVVPLIIPLGLAYGIDPIHLGIIFLANLELGYMTPPVGMNLFISSYRFEKSLPTIIRSVSPIFLVRLIGVLIITFVPVLSTTLPKLID